MTSPAPSVEPQELSGSQHQGEPPANQTKLPEIPSADRCWHFETELRRVLEASTSRILPSDDGPGAAETHVADYIERAIQHPWNRFDLPLFEQGLGFLQALAQETLGKEFLSCSEAEQDDVMQRAQVFPNNDARRFFERLIELTLEGFLCDPHHGGNRDHLGWKYVGYEPLEDSDLCRSETPASEAPASEAPASETPS